MFAVEVVLVLLIGYLLGSINTSLIVGKFKGIDIREHGSGNAGLTNTYRVMGVFASLLVIIGDILKAVLAANIGEYILGAATTIPRIGILVSGLGVILGHNFPIYFKFRGGKGVLVSGTIIFLMSFKLGLVLLFTFMAIAVVGRCISLASLGCAFVLPVTVFVLEESRDNTYFCLWSIVVSVLIFIMHRKNIRRLREGTEPLFTFSRRQRRRRRI